MAENDLVIGWRVTRGLDPEYWLRPNPEPGKQADENLVLVRAKDVALHTAIIAQSGSGKSFFLGRLIEELLVRTKARVLVLDPNGDFLQAHSVEEPGPWKEPTYDLTRHLGKLTHEASRAEFTSHWDALTKRIRTADTNRTRLSEDIHTELKLSWTLLSPDLLSTDVDSMIRGEITHCHELVRAVAELATGKTNKGNETLDVIDEAESLLERTRALAAADIRRVISSEYHVDESIKQEADKLHKERSAQFKDALKGIKLTAAMRKQVMAGIRTGAEHSIRAHKDRAIDTVCRVQKYISESAERFYFGKARSFQSVGVFDTAVRRAQRSSMERVDLEVVDMPSIAEPEVRRLAVNSLLATEWNRARGDWNRVIGLPSEQDDRVPTFIVIDEAHNLIPADPQDAAESALREQFRTIAAEGRKYGIFLILVSQRPDKLDSLILSECENRAVMKIGSQSVLAITKKMLGLEGISDKLLEKCLEFETGRGLLIGEWSVERPQLFYSAARRTAEGGRNLRTQAWATPRKLATEPAKKRRRASKRATPSKKTRAGTTRTKKAPVRKKQANK